MSNATLKIVEEIRHIFGGVGRRAETFSSPMGDPSVKCLYETFSVQKYIEGTFSAQKCLSRTLKNVSQIHFRSKKYVPDIIFGRKMSPENIFPGSSRGAQKVSQGCPGHIL